MPPKSRHPVALTVVGCLTLACGYLEMRRRETEERELKLRSEVIAEIRRSDEANVKLIEAMQANTEVLREVADHLRAERRFLPSTRPTYGPYPERRTR